MTTIGRLGEDEVRRRMSAIPAWRVEQDEIRRSFTFPDFITAFGFMSSVALLAERMSHHPNWSNVYNRVDIGLNTHDVGGISENDFRLAQEIDRLVGG